MADILIRKVSEEAKERLAGMAARAGSSLEAFLRQLLESTSAEAPRSNDDDVPISVLAQSLFADGSGEDLADILDNLEYAPESHPVFSED